MNRLPAGGDFVSLHHVKPFVRDDGSRRHMSLPHSLSGLDAEARMQLKSELVRSAWDMKNLDPDAT